MLSQQLYLFDDLDELYETADSLPEADRFDVYAHRPTDDPDGDDPGDWEQLGYRDSLWIEDNAVGDVSSNPEFYRVHDYGDIVEAVGAALEQYDDTVHPKGHARLSESGHKMTVHADFEGIEAEPVEGDVIDMGLKVRSAHTGYHGTKYDAMGERQICSNGMMAPVSELQFEQTHGEPLNYGLAQHAVDSIIEGTDVVEDRLQRATEYEFLSDDEAMLVLFDLGLDAYLEDPVDLAEDALNAEKNREDQPPTLYDTYNAATRLITHEVELSGDDRDYALEQAGNLLDRHGSLPDTTDLGREAVENRIDDHTRGDAPDPYWDGEEETLHDLLHQYGED
ncbi:hypothetical protein HT576_08700 [Haloterrigena sp. SYSU A121-1]|uniref:DUF932 domain-containing protein n=1 Tax=Haloterrigena gelatinilytica TaxID=2741724 RepID=A0A8J8GKT8_9EURY|nr:hypothetical protein [Haloterrigena gelatinilytica]NUB91098.1 hypothetical protein [Haloterrigena gelatinilytica]